MEGAVLNEGIEREIAADAEAVDTNEDVNLRADLKRVRRDRDVAVEIELGDLARRHADAHAIELWEARRQLELRVRAADGQDERLVARPRHAKRHRAVELEVHQAR